jgi:hypothetical protein
MKRKQLKAKLLFYLLTACMGLFWVAYLGGCIIVILTWNFRNGYTCLSYALLLRVWIIPYLKQKLMDMLMP